MQMNTYMRIEKLSPDEKRSIEECYIVGKLADDGTNLPRVGREYGKAIRYTDFAGPDKVVIYFSSISPEPSSLQEKLGKKSTEVFISFDNKNLQYLKQAGYLQAENKVDFLREHFRGKLILFKPVLSYDYRNESYHYNLEILLDEEAKEGENLEFIPVPKTRQGMTTGLFEKRLNHKNSIELTCYNHEMEIPEFIVCDKHIYYISYPDVLIKHPNNHNLYICSKPDKIRKIPFPDGYLDSVKMVEKEISFITTEKRQEWLKIFEKEGVSIISKSEVTDETNHPQGENQKKSRARKSSEITTGFISENQFMNRINFLARKKQLSYHEEDLYNLHTSLKTSNFTILGGMSGTGKTQLALLYAEALGLKNGENLLVIPISPTFTEPSDVLGFLNPQTGVYTESEVGLVSFLLRAKQKPDEIHMVLFDEMNLGQVEHYFSDFISLLEMPKNQRKLRLFSKKSYCHQEELRDGILIGDNVLFVGTANFDETTRDFSNRMLDRSNVILLEKMSFIQAKKLEEEKIATVDQYVSQEMNELEDPEKKISASNFVTWIKEPIGISSLTDEELTILDKIHEEMSNYDSQTGVSFRITKAIGHYLINIPAYDDDVTFLSREVAFDYQIKQRILTKIRGHREQIEDLVGLYEDKYIPGQIALILAEENDKSFEKSLCYLEQKAKELMRNGYTL